ncbi:MAG: maleylpyruvate isomerase N-terminal domain-containing protein [Gemmatimonadaceae bacterium]
MTRLAPLAALNTAPLFPILHGKLIQLLRALGPADWERPTVAGAWRVRDVAAHLLDGELRTLAAHRDGHALSAAEPPSTYEEVIRLIHQLNATGVSHGARLSPRLLTDLLEVTGQWMSAFVAALDPDAPALFPVAWAGESESDNRLDTAREYTERWHHQMQIRVALDDAGHRDVLLAPTLFHPLAETSVRALPHAYRRTEAADGATVVLRLTGEGPRSWTLRREGTRWCIYEGEVESPDAQVSATPDVLWRLFFNALPDSEARRALSLEGAAPLIAPLLAARSVMV